MKKYPIILLFIFLSSATTAQIINIPDAAFKNVLVNTNCVWINNTTSVDVDTNNDGEIQVSEAEAVTDLRIQNNSLTTISGVENFTNLTNLNSSGNPLGLLDLSTMPALTYLGCSSCQLTAIDLSAFPNLQGLGCANNLLTILDAGMTQLYYLDCNNNVNLEFINIKNGVI